MTTTQNKKHIINNDTTPLTTVQIRQMIWTLKMHIKNIGSFRASMDAIYDTFVILKILYQNKHPPPKTILTDLSLAFFKIYAYRGYTGHYGGGFAGLMHNIDIFIDNYLMPAVHAGYSPSLGFIADIYSLTSYIVPYLILFVTNIKLLDLIGIDYTYSTKIDALFSNSFAVPSFDFSKEEITAYLTSSDICGSIALRLLNTQPCPAITDEIACNIASRCVEPVSVFETMIKIRGRLSSEILEALCISSENIVGRTVLNIKLAMILDNKIQPTTKALYILLDNARPEFDLRKNTINKFDIVIGGSIDMFIRYGYDLTYDDMLYALSKGVIIGENIQRFNFNFDSKYFAICATIGNYPYVKLCASVDMGTLIVHCRRAGNSNLKDIRKIVKQGKLIPDASCMQEACQVRSNSVTIKYLVSAGGIITIECLENYIKYYGDQTLQYLINEFKNNNETTLKKAPLKNENNEVSDVKNKSTYHEQIPIISSIPLDFMAITNVFEMIPHKIKIMLMLPNECAINYRDYRSLMIKYLNDNELIKDSKITLKEPFLYKGNDTVNLSELNEWTYSLLICSEKTKENEINYTE